MRRILGVLRHPDIAQWFPGAMAESFVPPCGDNVFFLKIGGGFLAYFLQGDAAEVHACLLPEDRGPQTKAAILEQFEHLFEHGVKRIWGAPMNERAERKAVALGMRNTGERTERGFPIYEVTHG